jgi:hypothetical protein
MLKFIKFIPCLALILIGCSQSQKESPSTSKPLVNNQKPLSEAFKTYWYAGEAELTSYKLSQARYGELREGTAVMVFVTEPFLPEIQVKADRHNDSNIPVLKLNATKTFNTGIYPYSIMTSTFYPVANNQASLKVSASIQEWCGHVYTQLNNRKAFEITSHSYFQGEADQNFTLDKYALENDIWTQLRINPKDLSLETKQMIPSLEYLRLKHKELKPYNVALSQEEQNDTLVTTLNYPDLNRSLKIHQDFKFPFEILSWFETYPDGNTTLTTKAIKIKSLKSPYWQKNANKHEVLRDSLGL